MLRLAVLKNNPMPSTRACIQPHSKALLPNGSWPYSEDPLTRTGVLRKCPPAGDRSGRHSFATVPIGTLLSVSEETARHPLWRAQNAI